MKNQDNSSRAPLTRILLQEADVRGDAWLVSVMRPTGCHRICDMSVSQIQAVVDNFYSAGTARRGVVMI